MSIIPRLLRLKDLRALGVCSSWPQMGRLTKAGFPAGALLSPGVRVWTEVEVLAWLRARGVTLGDHASIDEGNAEPPQEATVERQVRGAARGRAREAAPDAEVRRG